jgi:two-component system, OmpR family, sensor histidine kinase KdpD
MRRALIAFGRRRPHFSGIALAAVATVALALAPSLPPEDRAFVYLLVVGVAAFSLGVRPALTATLASGFALSVFFFLIADTYDLGFGRSLALLASFTVVSLIAVAQAAEVRRREREVNANAERARLLADLGAELSRWKLSDSLTNRMARAMLDTSSSGGLVVFRIADDGLEVRKISDGMQDSLEAAKSSAQSVLEHWESAGEVVDGRLLVEGSPEPVAWQARPSGSALVPMCSFDSLEGIIYLRGHKDGTPFTQDDMELVIPISGMLAMRFEGMRLQSEEARKAALEASETLRTTLVAGMSHELKTPLTIAKLSIGGLMYGHECTNDETTMRALTEASRALNRLEALVAGMLDMAVIDADAWRAKMELSAVGDIIGSALYGLTAEQRNRIRLDFPDPVTDVWCDPRQIARVMRSLLGNALAYSPPGSPVTVGVREDGDWVVVWVHDSGPGVAPNEREAIFDRLYRGSAAKSSPGSGLGLSIAREIARLHGGDVVLADGVSGARFELRLPAYAPEGDGGTSDDG